MDPRSEVLLRQAELFQGSVLLAGLPADDLLGRLPDAHGWCWHAGDQAALDARFAERSHFGVNVAGARVRQRRGVSAQVQGPDRLHPQRRRLAPGRSRGVPGRRENEAASKARPSS